MRIVVALGGNALMQRGQPMTAAHQRENIRTAVKQLASIVEGNELVICHGNGPQVGLLALQAAADKAHEPFPLDILGAQTDGMIGYMIEQELGNLLPGGAPLATLLTQVEVAADDPAFDHPTKPIGPLYEQDEAEQLMQEKGWAMAPDGESFRRVVASPEPLRIFERRPIEWLLEKGSIVICAGGGGIPTCRDDNGFLRGVEAVIDKDRCSAVLAAELQCDCLIIATDVDAVYLDWGTDSSRPIRSVHPDDLDAAAFPAGSMGPKVEAACDFARKTGKTAVIGALKDIAAMLSGSAGTAVSLTHEKQS
ncbi:carbamate kinase [Allohahella marinimesophila]|uniref:Carbamate kinase n=1 Tax=Allohahella marinimesophila TaxID=1054972 RepID=A0ABP7P367_9GAMM